MEPLKELDIHFQRDTEYIPVDEFDGVFEIHVFRRRKRIGIMINAERMFNINFWWQYQQGKRAMEFLQQDTYSSWVKLVYLRLPSMDDDPEESEDDDSLDLTNMIGVLDLNVDDTTEDIQVMSHCPICGTLCRVGTSIPRRPRMHRNKACQNCYHAIGVQNNDFE